MIGLIALAVILALAIGLGVGLSQHNSMPSAASSASAEQTSENSSDTSTSPSVVTVTASQTSSTVTATRPAATSGFVGIADVQSPSINETVVTSGTSRFSILCAVHWMTGQPAANNNGTVAAVGSNRLIAYSLEEYLQHCVEYNNNLTSTADPNRNGSGCLAVTYNANLINSFARYQQNCFLKDREGVYDPAADTTESAVLISA